MANLEGWLYRKKVTVTGSADGAQADYTIPITVNFGSGTDSGSTMYCSEHCATDFDDIRFTASDGTTLLGHWLDEKTDSDNAVFWVKISSIDASPATLDVYVYYGNASAASTSDISAAFLVGDDFERTINCGDLDYASSALEIPCYTGSPDYQAIHVSPLDMGVGGWNGHRYWMAFTPYPGSANAYENPSIVVSDDKVNWSVPNGLTNPIVPSPSSGFNADTDLVYNDDTDELYIYFKWSDTTHKICAVKSPDGINWTDLDGGSISSTNPGTSVLGSLTSQELCPCVIKSGATWKMWTCETAYNDAGAGVFKYRESSDGKTWGTATICTRSVSERIWHFCVKYISSIGKYVSLVNRSPEGGPIYYMESEDGIAWTTAEAGLLPQRRGTWDAWMYRPTFLDNGDGTLDVFYSGKSAAGVWGTGRVVWSVSSIRASLSENSGWDLAAWNVSGTWRSDDAFSKRGFRSLKFARPDASVLQNGKKSITTPHSFKYTIDFYDSGAESAMQVARIYSATNQRVGVGVFTDKSTTHYVYHNRSFSYIASSVARTVGWHKFEIEVFADSSVVVTIDGQAQTAMTSQFATATNIGLDSHTFAGALTPNWWDDVRVRKSTANEPAITAYATEEYFPDDDTAPVLTGPTATATGPTTATASVTTDDGNGTLYFLASTNATESAATVKAALSQSVTAVGEQSISLSALDPETTYYVHFVQINGAGLESASVVSTSSITTPAIVYPEISATVAASSTSTVSATVTTDTAGGTIYGVLSTSATVMTAADIKSGADDTATVTDAGDYTLGGTGLATWTQYYWHIVHEDTDGLMSNVLTIPVKTLDISIPLAFSDTAPATLLTVQVWDRTPTKIEVESLYTTTEE